MRIVGVDTDSKGSFAVIDDESKTVTIHYVPSYQRELKGGQKRVTLNRNLTAGIAHKIFLDKVTAVYLEEQWSRPDQHAAATFSFGCVYCALYQALEGAAYMTGQIPSFVEVHSTIWKNKLGLTSDKEQARDLATKVFPLCEEAWKKSTYVSAAEATLIAVYGHTMETLAAGMRPDLAPFKGYTLILPEKQRNTLKNS